MNAADGVNGYGVGIRGLPPGSMLVKTIEHGAKRFYARAERAEKAAPLGLTSHVRALLQERKDSVLSHLASPVVNFVDPQKTIAKLSIKGSGPVRERVVNVSSSSPSCDCGAFSLESFPCGCMVYVAEKGGNSIDSSLHASDTNAFYKSIYIDLPEYVLPGTEGFEESAVELSEDMPQAPGRPSNKRRKGAMDTVMKAAHKARHVND